MRQWAQGQMEADGLAGQPEEEEEVSVHLFTLSLSCSRRSRLVPVLFPSAIQLHRTA
jgi:hypothetical protein